MQLSTKFRYGSRALSELALAWPERRVASREIAEKQDISRKYLDHILRALKAAGLIRSMRGRHGGYELARAPEQIRLDEVYRALEGSPAPVECVERPETCAMCGICPTRETWVEMEEAIEKVLADTTLQDLAERARLSREGAPLMYQI